MTEINKNIPKDVKRSKSLGFGRPVKDINDATYQVRGVFTNENGTFVFFHIDTPEDGFDWGMAADNLLGLDNNPVDEKKDRLVQDEGWVISLPAKKSEEPKFRKAS